MNRWEQSNILSGKPDSLALDDGYRPSRLRQDVG
jgi:hypothetical protein